MPRIEARVVSTEPEGRWEFAMPGVEIAGYGTTLGEAVRMWSRRMERHAYQEAERTLQREHGEAPEDPGGGHAA